MRFLYRDLDMLTRFAGGSGKNGGDSCGGGVHTSLVAGLMAEGLERRQFPMIGAAAVEHAHSARAPQRKIFGAVVAIRSA